MLAMVKFAVAFIFDHPSGRLSARIYRAQGCPAVNISAVGTGTFMLHFPVEASIIRYMASVKFISLILSVNVCTRSAAIHKSLPIVLHRLDPLRTDYDSKARQ